MTWTPLAGVASRPAEPGSGAACRRWRQDAAFAALVRTPCTALRAAHLPPLPTTTEERP
jgi:hypothetical protein